MTSVPRSAFLTRGLYAATALLVMVGLGLQLAPSAGRLEAKAANDSSSAGASPTGRPADTGRPNAVEAGDTDSSALSDQSPSSAAFGSVVTGDMSSGNANNGGRVVIPGEFQGVVIANIFSPERTPPRTRYRPRAAGEVETPSTPPVRAAPRGPRLFGVTLRANGAVALIDADPSVPGAEIYRIGDLVSGGRLIEINPTSVTIERGKGRQVLRLEIEPSVQGRPPPLPPADSLRDKQQ